MEQFEMHVEEVKRLTSLLQVLDGVVSQQMAPKPPGLSVHRRGCEILSRAQVLTQAQAREMQDLAKHHAVSE